MNDSQAFWQEKYNLGQTKWDLGAISPPLKAYIDQIVDKDCRILIPGCGQAYEAEYLFQQGFTNVFIVDIVEEPLLAFQKRNSSFPSKHVLCADFFQLEQTFDLILEQTFFCAILPEQRLQYIKKVQALLAEKGKFVGLLFDREFESGPPFGGNKADYEQLFYSVFSSVKIESCYNSVAPRQGAEVFFIAQK